jgi:hypothetical protein
MSIWLQIPRAEGKAALAAHDPTVMELHRGGPCYLQISHVGRVVDTHYQLADPTGPHPGAGGWDWHAVVRDDDGGFTSVPIQSSRRRVETEFNRATIDASPADRAAWQAAQRQLPPRHPAEVALERARRSIFDSKTTFVRDIMRPYGVRPVEGELYPTLNPSCHIASYGFPSPPAATPPTAPPAPSRPPDPPSPGTVPTAAPVRPVAAARPKIGLAISDEGSDLLAGIAAARLEDPVEDLD